MKKWLTFIFSLILSVTTLKPANAHDLWINVDNYYPSAGEKVRAKVVFGHNFPYEDILISQKDITEFSYVTPEGTKKPVTNLWEAVKGNRNASYKKGSLVGEINLSTCGCKEGTYVIIASRVRKGNKYHVPSEKYGKAIIVVGNKGTKNVSYVFGHRIEIVPLKNPSDVKPGDYFPVKVLFEGKPLSTYVYATYAGYWSETEPFPVMAKSGDDGIAYIKISRPGVWLIVCNHKVDFSASLTFEIK